jgi:hypothetical protein
MQQQKKEKKDVFCAGSIQPYGVRSSTEVVAIGIIDNTRRVRSTNKVVAIRINDRTAPCPTHLLWEPPWEHMENIVYVIYIQHSLGVSHKTDGDPLAIDRIDNSVPKGCVISGFWSMLGKPFFSSNVHTIVFARLIK